MASSVINAVIGGRAASKAASQMAEAQNAAANEQKSQYEASAADIARQRGENVAGFSPYTSTGKSAQEELAYQMGLTPTSSAAVSGGAGGSLVKPFTLADYEADPGYAFRLAEGQKALERAKAAGGKYFSGGAIKALTDYNQKSASDEYANAYDRYQKRQEDLFSRLSGMGKQGQQAASDLATSGDRMTLGQAELGANKSTKYGEDIMGAGESHAMGTLGKAQAWQTGLSALQGGSANPFGTSAGTPMGGGAQGPTQGSGALGFLTAFV